MLVGMGLGSAAQVEEALALVEGDFDSALQLLLSAAEAGERGGAGALTPDGAAAAAAAAAADEPLADNPPLADEKLELLMELAGCSLLATTKALACVRGDVDAASQRLLEQAGSGSTHAGDMLSPEELVWALRGSFASAGLRAQLEAICNADAQRLQV